MEGTTDNADNLRFDVSDRTRGPVYAQVRDELTRRITDGALAPDAELPAPASLAARLSTDAGEVQRAYYELERAGLLEKKIVGGFMGSKRTVYLVSRKS